MKSPKYLKIRDAIREDIRTGVLKVGDRIPTREKLIERFDVTRTTIDKALSELTRDKIIKGSTGAGTIVISDTIKMKIAIIVDSNKKRINLEKEDPNNVYSIFKSFLLQNKHFQIEFFEIDEKKISSLGTTEFDLKIMVQPNPKLFQQRKLFGDRLLILNRYGDDFSFISTNIKEAVYHATKKLITRAGPNCDLYYLDYLDMKGFVLDQRKAGFLQACKESDLPYHILNLSPKFEDQVLELRKYIGIDKKNVVISPSINFTGAVLRAIGEQGLRFNKDFFYCDHDNHFTEEMIGYSIPSILHDFQSISDVLKKYFDSPNKDKIQHFTPYILKDF